MFTKTCGHTIPKFKNYIVWAFDGICIFRRNTSSNGARSSKFEVGPHKPEAAATESLEPRTYWDQELRKDLYKKGEILLAGTDAIRQWHSHNRILFTWRFRMGLTLVLREKLLNVRLLKTFPRLTNRRSTKLTHHKLDGILPCKKRYSPLQHSWSHASSQIGNQSMSPNVWFPSAKYFIWPRHLGPAKRNGPAWQHGWPSRIGGRPSTYTCNASRGNPLSEKADLGPENLIAFISQGLIAEEAPSSNLLQLRQSVLPHPEKVPKQNLKILDLPNPIVTNVFNSLCI